MWRKLGAPLIVVWVAAIAGGCATTSLGPTGEASPELAVRIAVAERLAMPVSLRVETYNKYDEWAFLAGQPLTAEGIRIDYMHTPYAKDFADGYFDDNFAALVRHSADVAGGWRVVELSIGATDAPFIGWLERYGLPLSMVISGSTD